MSRVRISRKDRLETPELNITAFLNLMVILVPFLLITAVFSHMSILDLNLPPANQGKQDQPDEKKQTNFELIIRKDKVTIADTNGGPIKSFPVSGGSFDSEAVNELLVRIKSKFPEKMNITLLLENKVPYEMLVKAMDTVRVYHVEQDGEKIRQELFPQISIGDAPPRGPVVQ